MSFHEELASRLKLTGKEKEALPSSYHVIGKIMLFKLKSRNKKAIGEAVLEMFPYLDTVAEIKEIRGRKRKPEIEIIAGKRSTLTKHREHGCVFWLDIGEIMFSKGNKSEKLRIVSSVRPGETIVDMFSGIGYWSIPIAKKTKVKRIYAIDINKKAIGFLEKNVFENKIERKIKVLQGDCRRFAPLLRDTADRIIMGYFPCMDFLPYALQMARKGCTIHLHDVSSMEDVPKKVEKINRIAKKNNSKLFLEDIQQVKSYAPNIYHLVFDLKKL